MGGTTNRPGLEGHLLLRSRAVWLRPAPATHGAGCDQPRQPRPKGLGKRTAQLINRELCDPKRFNNRRQVSSYLGLCPGEHSSGARKQRGSITKTGNPRLIWALIDAAWRLVHYQPDCRLRKKWREQILNLKLEPGRRRQLIVASARGFDVDWWRLCTGQPRRKNSD